VAITNLEQRKKVDVDDGYERHGPYILHSSSSRQSNWASCNVAQFAARRIFWVLVSVRSSESGLYFRYQMGDAGEVVRSGPISVILSLQLRLAAGPTKSRPTLLRGLNSSSPSVSRHLNAALPANLMFLIEKSHDRSISLWIVRPVPNNDIHACTIYRLVNIGNGKHFS
jgi:hypothetical protein